ncbi:protein phosphatase 1 regulatory subunit 3C [Anastrepha ludens]|uniref:protein phosphatase 1 regulatory subunit 3C n=1 Tax=Anastrepha ludens TaxID=28586 RepID=UPI0023AF8F31|nr:protein phosphatase 1 regulatory subunit 3C [Anastrepha ludens]XP_053954310.1 protein phosphatase 1 regulatory subunit 3C [Anastrepha ludens]
MISHSPPIFSHSPPVSFLSDYMNNHRYNDETNRASRYCRPQVITLASKAMANSAAAVFASHQLHQQHQQQQQQMQRVPITVTAGCLNGQEGRAHCGLPRTLSAPVIQMQPKSCLSRKFCLHRSAMANNSNDSRNSDAAGTETECVSCKCSEQSRCRKRVIFADDEGQPLTEVRVMSEPSNVPPLWSTKFLEQITQGLVSPHPADQWTVDFKQPASDYLSFRQKIDRDFVSLENVIVKDEESIVVGTVKVKNISFEKEVIVRVTWDDWKSQQDIFCTFARAYGPATFAHVVFDTFSFKITLPPSSKRLEFCICYRAKCQEYWDNREGKNYTITKRSPFYYNALSPYDKNTSRNTCRGHVTSALSEALANSKGNQAQNNWSQESGPYWQQKRVEEKYW